MPCINIRHVVCFDLYLFTVRPLPKSVLDILFCLNLFKFKSIFFAIYMGALSLWSSNIWCFFIFQ